MACEGRRGAARAALSMRTALNVCVLACGHKQEFAKVLSCMHMPMHMHM